MSRTKAPHVFLVALHVPHEDQPACMHACRRACKTRLEPQACASMHTCIHMRSAAVQLLRAVRAGMHQHRAHARTLAGNASEAAADDAHSLSASETAAWTKVNAEDIGGGLHSVSRLSIWSIAASAALISDEVAAGVAPPDSVPFTSAAPPGVLAGAAPSDSVPFTSAAPPGVLAGTAPSDSVPFTLAAPPGVLAGAAPFDSVPFTSAAPPGVSAGTAPPSRVPSASAPHRRCLAGAALPNQVRSAAPMTSKSVAASRGRHSALPGSASVLPVGHAPPGSAPAAVSATLPIVLSAARGESCSLALAPAAVSATLPIGLSAARVESCSLASAPAAVSATLPIGLSAARGESCSLASAPAAVSATLPIGLSAARGESCSLALAPAAVSATLPIGLSAVRVESCMLASALASAATLACSVETEAAAMSTATHGAPLAPGATARSAGACTSGLRSCLVRTPSASQSLAVCTASTGCPSGLPVAASAFWEKHTPSGVPK
eukprot:365554-Chlamydomonas_euryale.AAC.37